MLALYGKTFVDQYHFAFVLTGCDRVLQYAERERGRERGGNKLHCKFGKQWRLLRGVWFCLLQKIYVQIPQNIFDQEFTENGKVAELRKTMTLFKNLLNFDKLLERKFCRILRVLKEL